MNDHKSLIYKAAPLPQKAKDNVNSLLETADFFRYTAAKDSQVSLLEEHFAEMMGAKYALAVSSCSAAMFLSLHALDIGPGDKVLIPAFTFAAVPSAIVHAGAQPVLVECMGNYRIDLDDLEQKVDPNVKAILISHMRGHTSDMDAITKLAERYNLPIIEDAAHSLGTMWNDKKIGTIGKVGCFSFQSYKMVNGGEGGILITDDDEIFARAVIMSGAYEHMWRKHPTINNSFAKWQNKVPLYNLRLSNLAAAVIEPQLSLLPTRVNQGLKNHNYVASLINQSPWICVPEPLPQESRAPDSLQFNLVDFSDEEVKSYVQIAKNLGVDIQVFGMTQDNARAFWNWQFFGEIPELPQTREMLMRACDMRLPAHLPEDTLDFVAQRVIKAAEQIKR